MVREGQLLSISPVLFLSSTSGCGDGKRVKVKHTGKPCPTFVSGTVSLAYLHANASVIGQESFSLLGRTTFHCIFRAHGGGTTFSERQHYATYQYAYSKDLSSHSFSLILLKNILS